MFNLGHEGRNCTEFSADFRAYASICAWWPFANIAHGCNSVVATHAALKLADYVVTEAGFGADLGPRNSWTLKCPSLKRRIVVVVATIRSLKMHGGVLVKDLNEGEMLKRWRLVLPICKTY